MPALTTTELKKALTAAGFEVYRTLPDRVVLADRVRDNLIMDSGVAAGTGLAVFVTVRAQRNDFPTDAENELWQRARQAGAEATGRGYKEVDAQLVPVPDPGDSSRILDTWYEVSYEREVRTEAELFDELRFALGLNKTAARRR